MEIPYVVVLCISMFCMGTCIASFTECASLRYKAGIDIFSRKSYCDSCKKNLRKCDLIPVIGYIINRGMCRHCSSKIPARYPLCELLTGLSFSSVFLLWVLQKESMVHPEVALYVLVVIICAVIDFEIMEVPYTTWATMGVLTLAHIFTVDITKTEVIMISVICLIFTVIMCSGMGYGDIVIYVTGYFMFGAIAGSLVLLISGIIGVTIYVIENKLTGKVFFTKPVGKTKGVRMVPAITVAMLICYALQSQGLLDAFNIK